MVAGVTVVAAAGNSAFEALYFTPANCPDSLTVSAFVDLNGSAGGNGSVTINGVLEYEETFANSFSNYSDFCWDLNGDGQCTDADTLVVNLMALGVKIFSTLPTSPVTLNDPTGADKELNYDTLTGTSMATAPCGWGRCPVPQGQSPRNARAGACCADDGRGVPGRRHGRPYYLSSAMAG